MERGLRFAAVTLQNAPQTTLVERWQCLGELGRLATEVIPKLRA